ncbi:MAG: KOW domain-containing RNA-binding protein [Tepidanaerobacteraceae bacterium]|jgi:large subunit ribosomal protein L14e|nr:RNA-binding protein [Tepidanaerobacter sp.]HQE05353.1 KOW domain-containing RNA-binding protein [Tepidanaerobacteraceae bacterium]
MPQLMLGQLAKSIAGRDKGRYMVIIDIIDENYVYVVDGDLRRVENPKKKKIKHLQMLNKRADLIAEKLAKKRKINNEDIKEALNELIDVSQEGKSNQI